MPLGWLLQAIDSLSFGIVGAFTPASARRPSVKPESWDRQQMILLFWKLRRAYESSLQSGALEDLARAFDRLSATGVSLTELVVAWVDLIETVVQETEAAFGSKRGAGELKKAYAKSILIELISRSRVAKAAVDLFTTSVIWAAVDIAVDTIVRLIDYGSLWTNDESDQALAQNNRWFRLLFRYLSLKLLNILAWLYTRQLTRLQLSPAVQRSVDRVLATHPIDPLLLSDGLRALFDWFGEHRREIVAFVDLVAAAAHQAELFASLSGPEKQRYARDLVVSFIEVEFGPSAAGLLNTPLARIVLDTAIDAVVMILRKRGVFRPGQQRVPPGAAFGVRMDRLEREAKPAAARATP